MYICNCLFLTELTSKTDVQTLTGKALSVTAGTASPGPAPSTDTIACPYVNLLLCNAQPAGERSSHRNWIYVHNTLFSLLKINLRLTNVLFERNIEKIFFVLFCFVFVLFIFAFIFEIELVLNEKFDIDFAPDQISSTGASNIDSYIYSFILYLCLHSHLN